MCEQCDKIDVTVEKVIGILNDSGLEPLAALWALGACGRVVTESCAENPQSDTTPGQVRALGIRVMTDAYLAPDEDDDDDDTPRLH